jgi:hypothetical protein
MSLLHVCLSPFNPTSPVYDTTAERAAGGHADFMMKPGMVYWLNNHVVYHGRDGWLDSGAAVAEEATSGGRLLFRTWLSPYNSRALPDTATFRKVRPCSIKHTHSPVVPVRP